MTQLWSSKDEQSAVWDLSIWPGRLRLESSTLSTTDSSTTEVSIISSVEEQPSTSSLSSKSSETLDFDISFGSPKVWSSEEEVGFRWGDSLWSGQLVREDSDLVRVSAISPDIEPLSTTGESALSSTASSKLVETSDSSHSTTDASKAGTFLLIDDTTEFSSSEEASTVVDTTSSPLQPDVFSSTDEETILSISAGKTERTLSSSKSNELLSIESEVPSVSLFAPDATVDTVAVIDKRAASLALSAPITTVDFSSSVDEPINTGSEASPSESFEIRSVIERDALNPSISASPTGSRNILSLDFNFLVGVNSTLLISDDKETISSEDVTEIEDETNIVIVKPSENEVILE